MPSQRLKITSDLDGADVTPTAGNHGRQFKVPGIPRPICAIWHAEELLKTNNPADLKARNSSEICPPDATLRSDLNLTLDQVTALHLCPLSMTEISSAPRPS